MLSEKLLQVNSYNTVLCQTVKRTAIKIPQTYEGLQNKKSIDLKSINNYKFSVTEVKTLPTQGLFLYNFHFIFPFTWIDWTKCLINQSLHVTLTYV